MSMNTQDPNMDAVVDVITGQRPVHRLLQAHHWNRVIRLADKTGSSIRFRDEVIVDDYLTVTIGDWGGYLIQIMPMIFNDRLVMTPQSCPYTYDYGWCFPKGGAAGLSALAWDPEFEAEPVGFLKRITIFAPRTAGTTAASFVS